MDKPLNQKLRTIFLGDTDAAGRIFFAKAPEWCHEVWEEFLELRGLPISSFLKGDFHLPIVNIDFQYKNSIQLGDKILVSLTSIEKGERSLKVNYEIAQPDTSKVCIAGQIIHVCLDLKTRQAIPLPAKLIEKI